MSDLEKLIKDLPNKVDSFQKDLDHLKDRSGKRKKDKKHRFQVSPLLNLAVTVSGQFGLQGRVSLSKRASSS